MAAQHDQLIGLDQLNDVDFQKAFKYFCGHLVALAVSYKTIDSAGSLGVIEQRSVLSGFILSFRGSWWWITAGHILKDLDTPLIIRITQSLLLDSFRSSIVSDMPIPFEFEESHKVYVHDEDEGLDFGLIQLHPHIRRLLEANNVIAVPEENWIHQHNLRLEHYFMLGFPSKFQSVEERNGEIIRRTSAAIIRLRKFDSSSYKQKKYTRLILKIDDQWKVGDIDGMSGGPILAFSDEKKDRYWVVAVQSSWLESKGVVFACPIPVLASVVADRVDAVDSNTH